GKIVDDVRNAGDIQSKKAVHAAIEYVDLGLPDLRVGIASIYDRIAPQSAENRPALPNAFIDEWIGGAHIAYASIPLMFIVESYVVQHLQGSSTWTTYGGFALAG